METRITYLVGIDWSRESHQVSVLNKRGKKIKQFAIEHTRKGFLELHSKLSKLGCEAKDIDIAIETDHNQIADYLYECDYQIYIIPPSVVKGNRSRQSNAGAKDDTRDADLLADILRTDQHRLKPWRPASDLVQDIRVQITLIDGLTKDIIRDRNRLEAHLLRYFPHGIDIFSTLTTQIALKFLIQYPKPSQVDQLTFKCFSTFCKHNGYHQSLDKITERYGRLKQKNPFSSPSLEERYAGIVPILASQLLGNIQTKITSIKKLNAGFWDHPDALIFDSLPGCGDLLGPKMLAIFGDNRDHYPHPDTLRALAGTCPVTLQSGKSKSVYFRKACNHSWRNAFQQLAISSTAQSDWAASYYAELRGRGKKESQAYRCLANRWVGIIWKLWQTNQTYDESVHMSHIARFKR